MSVKRDDQERIGGGGAQGSDPITRGGREKKKNPSPEHGPGGAFPEAGVNKKTEGRCMRKRILDQQLTAIRREKRKFQPAVVGG